MKEQYSLFLQAAVLEIMGNFIKISLLRFESGTVHVLRITSGCLFGGGGGMELRMCIVHSFILPLVRQSRGGGA
jgi:drug/metabolite transporter superfamily protein YnfA